MPTKLFSPLALRAVTLRNRIAVSPMCQYSAKSGYANDWHLVHYGSRAVGGAGLVIVEAAAVRPEGRITPDDLGLWDDAHIPALRRIASFIEAQGCAAGIQLAHAGRKGSIASEWKGGRYLSAQDGGWRTVAPSAIPFSDHMPAPRALTAQEAKLVACDFAGAARRAVEAGFRVIEIHAAHGYLLHEFLSPLSNRRTDEYGGCFENRARLVLETVRAVREAIPDSLPLCVRISATDWADGGWDIGQSVELADLLKQYGVDLIDVSGGGLVPYARIPSGPGYQVSFAARIRRETGMKTGAVGLITTAGQAEEILEANAADLILMGREFLRDPYFPLHAASELYEDMKWPAQYARAKTSGK
ncbi:NADH:flavin oxidoreductase/NADH oxidase [Rikenella microfusus]|uniref:NADH:flavin oxidoreductase/NADH oxidase n=1 Tax=Rikenella microfusus TaxID=28139 RepID=UPI001DCC5C2B|nr:NADH:flavin oxidoreductase/NADH oxidase [Rikenella microfusus]HJE89054.1 NADH:flavin oxidoreductase/NADH oxidase [Rikenella microfusus]